MRILCFVTLAVLFIAGCGGPGESATTKPNPAGSTPTTTKPSSAAATPDSSGTPSSTPAASSVRLTIDGQPVPLEGGAKSSTKKIEAAGQTLGSIVVEAGSNANWATRKGYGVQLEIQSAPGKGELKEGFTVNDVATATFTVWKDDQFSYISMGTIPGQPMKELKLERTAGSLVGSFEQQVNGPAGKFLARIDFNMPFPK